MRLSVLICAYNEALNLPPLCARLLTVLEGMGIPYEVVIVNDGSQDETRAVLDGLAASNVRIKAVHLIRNFGQHAAIAAGMRHVSGDAVVWMDADLQDVPEEIPRLVAPLQEGFDVVYGVRVERQDSLFRRMGSNLYFSLFRLLTGQKLPRGISTFRALSRKVIDAFNHLGERSRMTAGLIGWLGFRTTTVPVEHAPRGSGQSKYNVWSLIRLTLDGMTGYSYLPLRLASFLGLSVSFMAALYALVIGGRKFFFAIDVPGYASLMVSVLFMGGVQLIILGILGEYVGRILTEVQARPLFLVDEVVNAGPIVEAPPAPEPCAEAHQP